MRKCVMGIDPALVKLGWAVIMKASDKDKTATWQTGTIQSKKDGVERLKEIRDGIIALAKSAIPELIVIEGYSWGSKFQGPALGEVGGVIRLALFEAGFKIEVVAPSSLKKFVTGSGRADKPTMRQKIFKRWKGAEFDTQDEAEAFALAQWGFSER
ncbi:MAG: crossover junction endodeoxyribonuclease RuvC [Candidatus Yanofskybacteria bacterium]|nr:crossover junction endodeoxyribonuclease RuvC [Candidatus Yanofskybacteria bacterium]